MHRLVHGRYSDADGCPVTARDNSGLRPGRSFAASSTAGLTWPQTFHHHMFSSAPSNLSSVFLWRVCLSKTRTHDTPDSFGTRRATEPQSHRDNRAGICAASACAVTHSPAPLLRCVHLPAASLRTSASGEDAVLTGGRDLQPSRHLATWRAQCVAAPSS